MDIDRLTVRLFLTLTYLDYYKNYSFKFSSLVDLINQDVNHHRFKRVHSIQKIELTYEDLFMAVIFFSIIILITYFKFI